MLATTRRRVIAATGLVLAAGAAAIAWWLISPLFVDTVVDEAFPFDVPTQAEMDDMPPAEVEALEAAFEAAMPSDGTIQALSVEDRAEVAEKVMTAAAMLPGDTVDEPMPTAEAPEPTPTADTPSPTPTAAVPEAAPTATPAPQPTVAASAATPTAAPPEPTPTAAPPAPTPTAAAPEAPPPPAGPVAVLKGAFADADSFHLGEGTATIYQTGDGMLTLRLEDFAVTNGPALSVLLSSHPAPARSDELGKYLDLGPLKGNKGNQNYQIDLPRQTVITEYASVVIYCVPFHVVFSTASLAP